MALCLDWLQLRGEVVHMEWTRGHMVYPWSSRSWHNTLLLDMTLDCPRHISLGLFGILMFCRNMFQFLNKENYLKTCSFFSDMISNIVSIRLET